MILSEYALFLKQFHSNMSPLDPIKSIALKPLLGLFYNQKNGSSFRRYLMEGGPLPTTDSRSNNSDDDFIIRSSRHTVASTSNNTTSNTKSKSKSIKSSIPVWEIVERAADCMDDALLDQF